MDSWQNVMHWQDWWWLWALEHCLAGYGFSHTLTMCIVAILMMIFPSFCSYLTVLKHASWGSNRLVVVLKVAPWASRLLRVYDANCDRCFKVIQGHYTDFGTNGKSMCDVLLTSLPKVIWEQGRVAKGSPPGPWAVHHCAVACIHDHGCYPI